MSKLRSLKLAGTLAALAVLAGASESRAGYTYNAAVCYKNADGSGECYGTFRDFKNSPGANDYVQFQYNSTPGYVTYAFYASLNGVFYYCSPNSTLQAVWPMLQANRGYFDISWNSSGTCTNIWVNNGSYTQSF